LTVANDGTTYVTDQVGELGRVIRLGVDGVASVVTDELREPRGVALSSDALLVVDLASSALWAVEASTGRLDMLAQLSGPTGALALSADGRVYVGDAEGVLVLTPAGATAGRIDLPEPVTGIALTAVRIYLTSATSLYVCEGKTS
jgi:sugar lactone lactonase YvrE